MCGTGGYVFGLSLSFVTVREWRDGASPVRFFEQRNTVFDSVEDRRGLVLGSQSIKSRTRPPGDQIYSCRP